MKHGIVIGFSGKMGSGKDYTAELVVKRLKDENKTLTVTKTAFADSVRREVDEIATLIKESYGNEIISDLMGVSWGEIAKIRELFSIDEDFEKTNYSTFNRGKGTRALLQYWGTDVRRKHDTNYWVNKTKDYIRELQGIDLIVVTDVRFPNEADAIKDLNGLLVRTEVNESTRMSRLKERNTPTSIAQLTHASETGLDSYSSFSLIVHTDKPGAEDEILTKLRGLAE